MKAYLINRFFGILILALFSFSCSSDLDFNQANDLKLEPVFITNLSYFDIPANDFVDNGTEQNISFDAQDFDVFRDSFLRENLRRADFSFEITNTINRAYSFDLNLIDQNDAVIYTIRMNIPASTGTAVIRNKTEIFENAKLDLLKASRRMEFVLVMAPGPALSENSLGSLKLRSSATVYLVVE
ncbi:hypothetical protein [Flavobacterium frigoris]|uniref:Lipoprotein n=1 Tax=Flavobacterium frigoris (strain PS1) TaxID=1086011 RepID=H7FTA7_FLAFP|nr:hypothetical protein [Flavobacterium frigoris]EIA08161.1 hypothetical protein HJ01_01883 [Flavobacterium frigoris PS1]